MKSASFLRFGLFIALVGALALALTGCFSTTNLALTQGNWSATATSSTPANGTFLVGGNLTQTGSALSGNMHIGNSLCFDPSLAIAFTGIVRGQHVSLTSASVNGQVLTVTATGTTGSALSGTYTLSGGSCANGDTGTVTANAVPTISGTWNGPIVGDFYGDPNAALSIVLTQATTASADGTFALTGNVTYSNSSCSSIGTLDNSSYLAGNQVVINASTDVGTGQEGAFTYSQTTLDNAAAPTSMAGDYEVTFGNCSGDGQTLTLTKQ